ncbi:hypothetical protein CSOJ01_02931 [Colletotrichum sojae]|uniref:Uncharacterized protein n=1 Tax=Colletotrichum sojae TaxID=2175907 RepID=A0A8H6JNL3_9PEZI|nr:hypothetical protein CSOJ01_02931 [Colletotrichum sojae]
MCTRRYSKYKCHACGHHHHTHKHSLSKCSKKRNESRCSGVNEVYSSISRGYCRACSKYDKDSDIDPDSDDYSC